MSTVPQAELLGMADLSLFPDARSSIRCMSELPCSIYLMAYAALTRMPVLRSNQGIEQVEQAAALTCLLVQPKI